MDDILCMQIFDCFDNFSENKLDYSYWEVPVFAEIPNEMVQVTIGVVREDKSNTLLILHNIDQR
jgi:hypothetical protein